MNNESDQNCFLLPKLWIKQLFNISEEQDSYLNKYFCENMSILDCKIKVPRRGLWKGHSFYYDIMKSYEKLLENVPRSVEQIFSMPLWFNRFLNTKFDEDISKAGYNYVKDMFPGGTLIELKNLVDQRLRPNKKHKLITIIQSFPKYLLNCISKEEPKCTVIYPFQTINVNGSDQQMKYMNSKVIYQILIRDKIKLPTGMLNWCYELELSDLQIRTAFTFAHDCTASVFDRVFQYKIATQILPTNDYLKRYKVKDSNVCEKCNLEFDSIDHSLFSCSEITQVLSIFFKFLKDDCNISANIGMNNYLFGFHERKFRGLNHVLLELKKSIFYDWESNMDAGGFCEKFKSNIKRLIVKEKILMCIRNEYEKFDEKWGYFTTIYDFRGPDIQI